VSALVATLAGLFLFLAAFIVLVAIHEFGHVTAGWLCHFHLHRLQISFLRIECGAEAKWTWQWVWRSKTLFGGQTIMFPPSAATSHLAPRCAFIFLGGPLANLLVAAVAWPVALTHSVAGGVCRLFVLASLFFAVVNLVPSSTPLGRIDGAKLFDLAFRPRYRAALLFGVRLLPRLNEIRTLSRAHRHREALDSYNEILEEGACCPPPYDEWLSKEGPALRRLRAFLERSAAGCDHDSDSAVAPEARPPINTVPGST
jgi:hypothetical protein